MARRQPTRARVRTRANLAGLDELLQTIMHSDKSFDRDDVFARIASCLSQNLRFYIVIRERRRFNLSPTDVETDRLYLPFLTFGFDKGQVKTFENPRSVNELVEQRESKGLLEVWDRPKSQLLADETTATQKPTLFEKVEAVLLAFYYACGHYDHFMSNASRRFAKEFLRQQKPLTISGVIQAVRANTQCEIVHLIHSEDDHSRSVAHDEGACYDELSACTRFRRDLDLAIERRGTFTGHSSTGYAYIISVTGQDRSYESIADAKPSHGIGLALGKKRHALVLCRRPGPISMDAVKFGPNLFNLHLANDAFTARERLIFEIYRSVAQVERSFVSAPPARRADINAILRTRYEEILRAATNVTAAELLIIRLYDPITNKLPAVSAVCRGQTCQRAYSLEPDDAPFRAFRAAKAAAVRDMPAYVARELNSDATDELFAGLVFPFRVGGLTQGVLECYSARRAQLQFDEEYLGAIADAIGDVSRRLESASDVAWLSRLSFLHSARHELENFTIELLAKDRALHSMLRSTLDRYSGLSPAPYLAVQRFRLSDKLEQLLSSAPDFVDAGQALQNQIMMLEETFTPDAAFDFMFSEVMSTLVANATKHSTLRAIDFSFSFKGRSTDLDGLTICYRSADKRIAPEHAARVAVSPIPDSQTSSFHYGLFLAAAQVRMNGGTVRVETDAEPELDTIPFRICFTLPFHPLSSNDAY